MYDPIALPYMPPIISLTEADMRALDAGVEQTFIRRLGTHLRETIPGLPPENYAEEAAAAVGMCKEHGLKNCSTMACLAEILVRVGALPVSVEPILASPALMEEEKRMRLQEYLGGFKRGAYDASV